MAAVGLRPANLRQDVGETVRVDVAKVMEALLAETFKPVGFRKRARNWFRTTSTDQYQVVNLQKSSWGGGDCYLNLGWHPVFEPGSYLAESHCMARFRAEQIGVIPTISVPRADGTTILELPGIRLLESKLLTRFSDDAYRSHVREVVVQPVADLLDRTPSVTDLVPLFRLKPGWATVDLRDYLRPLGIELPTKP